jgi:hypothetical protein
MVLRLERALPGRRHAALAAGDQRGQPALLRGVGTATVLWLDFTVLVVATVAAITAASALLGRLTR